MWASKICIFLFGLQKYVVFTIGLKIMGSLKSGPQKYGVLKLWASKIRGPHNVGSWKCWLQNCGNKNLDSWLIIICTAYMYIINIYSFLSIKLPSWNILLSSSTFLVLYNILYTHSLSIKLPSWNICCPLVPPLCYIIYYILIPYQSNSPLGTFVVL